MSSAAIFTKIQSGMRRSDGKVYCAPRNMSGPRGQHRSDPGFLRESPRDNRDHIEERTDRLKTHDYFAFLCESDIGNVFSHWTWLPGLRTQWDQAGGFTGAWSVTRLLTPLRVGYEDTYARYHPFAELKGEFPQMYRDAAFIIDQGRKAGLPTVTVANNRAGGTRTLSTNMC